MINNIIHYFERKAFGVCEWLGKKVGVNPSIIRRAFIYFSFITLVSPLLIYFILAFILDNKDYLKRRKKRKTVWDI